MKKQLLLLVVILLPMVARAASVEIDGIYYELVGHSERCGINVWQLDHSCVCYLRESGVQRDEHWK